MNQATTSKGEGDFFHNLIHPSPLSSPARGEDFILLQFKICVQVSAIGVKVLDFACDKSRAGSNNNY
jgi:hypothetical protein